MSDLTCKQAGRLGGLATKARIGTEGYRALGAKTSRPRAYFAAIGRKGGKSLTPAQREATSRAGGEALLTKYGKDHFREIARLGWARRRAEQEGTT